MKNYHNMRDEKGNFQNPSPKSLQQKKQLLLQYVLLEIKMKIKTNLSTKVLLNSFT
jgi:hypothetical protein